MNVKVLGCSGAIAKGCRTTAFLVDHDLLIDAGTGVGDLSLEDMCKIDDVFLTHSHLDHVVSLPLMLDSVGARRTQPLRVHGLASTLAALKTHIFNDIIWPDFSVIPTKAAPYITFHEIEVGCTYVVGGRCIEVLPAVHAVPAVGYAVAGLPHGGGAGHEMTKYWVFSGDTERNPEFWRRVNQLPIGVLVIETTFSNSEKVLAQRSLHLCAEVLIQELHLIEQKNSYPIYITHIKPAEMDAIMQEIEQLNRAPLSIESLTPTDMHTSASSSLSLLAQPKITPVQPLYQLEWLVAGQEFSL